VPHHFCARSDLDLSRSAKMVRDEISLFVHGFENARPAFFSGAPDKHLTASQQHLACLVERLEFQDPLEFSYGIFKVLLEIVTQSAFVLIAHLENRLLNGSSNAKQFIYFSTLGSPKDRHSVDASPLEHAPAHPSRFRTRKNPRPIHFIQTLE